VRLQPQGTRPPIVLIPGVLGYAFHFRRLTHVFGDEQPLFALQLLGANPEEPVSAFSIEEMAAVFEPQVLAACPRGPVILGGYSMGILPAFELARRLEKRGREVPLLVSLEGFAPQFYRENKPLAGHAMSYVRGLYSDARRQLAARSRALSGILPAPGHVPDAVLRSRTRGRASTHSEENPAFARARANEREDHLNVLRKRAVVQYRSSWRAPGSLLLVKASEPIEWLRPGHFDPHYGWKNYVRGDVSTITLPGNHENLLGPYDNQVAIADAVRKSVGAVPFSSRAQGVRDQS
jgi:thioesterase domain-containing protein